MKIFYNLKSWENYKIINIINLIIILKIKKNILKKRLKNFYIIFLLLNLIVNSKLDFYFRHIIFVNVIKNILIYNISFIYFLLFKNNLKKILIKIKIKNNLKNKIKNIIIIFNIIKNTNYFNVYISINNNIYKIINIINIFLKKIYWISLINLNFNYKILLNISLFIVINIINWIHIFFEKREIYNTYSLCGKVDKTNVIFNQQIFSLIYWLIKPIFYINNLILIIKFIKN